MHIKLVESDCILVEKEWMEYKFDKEKKTVCNN